MSATAPAATHRLPLVEGGRTGLRANRFKAALREHGTSGLVRDRVTTLQVNVGKRCNQACHHCHVEAGPKRSEVMPREVAERVVALLEANPEVEVVDLTGGAPELNPNFRWLVAQARRLGRQVIDRCNLTVMFEPGMQDLADFLADHEVRIVASLPCYEAANVEQQRGRGVFDKSVSALQELNARGYGRAKGRLQLDLVYNPVGASLPPAQAVLEGAYKQQLAARHGIAFNRLLTLTNMPIKRFAHLLERTGQHAQYMALLANHFNPGTVPELMCRSLLSVGWDGRLYDCDFNQMLELPLGAGATTLWDVEQLQELRGRPIAVADHCFGCTAGAGSSCGGALE